MKQSPVRIVRTPRPMRLAAIAALATLVASPLAALASEFSYDPADANRDAYVTPYEQFNYDAGLWSPGDPVPSQIVTPVDDDLHLPDGRVNSGEVGGM